MDELGRSREEREQARLERQRRRTSRGREVAEPPESGPMQVGGDGLASADQLAKDGSARGRVHRAGRPRRPVPPPGPHRAHEYSRAGRAMAVLALLLVVLVLWFLVELFQPFSGSGHGRVTVTIPRHASTSQVADILDRAGVISCFFPSCPFLFELRAKLEGANILAGTYRLQQGMSFSAALSALSTPPPAAKVTNVTVIPGETRVHLAQLLRQQGVAGNYLVQTRHSTLLNPASYGAPASTPDLEGFLFPDTYQLRVPVQSSALVADQLTDFKRRFSTVNLSYAKAHRLTAYDVLIVASLVQAEAQTRHDFPLVASTIYNRLRINMPLELDSTTRYATGNYNHPLTVSQLHSSSPWNTHTHSGLPPTPIDSPGLSAIEAAAHPAQTDYLYFVSEPCRSGALAFSSGYSTFLANVQKLQAAHGHFARGC
jgi:UPF0755 protein